MHESIPKLVIILGPTAAGKSQLSLRLAENYGFEIISADSLLVYKYLDIGTAKPGKDILKSVPHHLVDIIEPSEEFNAGQFNIIARSVIEKLTDSDKKILVVGGTYLYIKILTEGIIDKIEADKEYRAVLKKQRNLYGNGYIYEKLKLVDPESSKKINCNDYVRMERALEVYNLTGVKMSELQNKHGFGEKSFDVLKIGLRIGKDLLIRNIESRTNYMLENGLIQEVQKLLDSGYDNSIKSLKSIGYKEAIDYLSGKIDKDELKNLIIKNTKRLAKRQMTWLKRDSKIKWFDVPYDYNAIKKEIEMFYGDNV